MDSLTALIKGHPLVKNENLTHYRGLDDEIDALFYALMIGFYEQVCRSQNVECINLMLNQIDLVMKTMNPTSARQALGLRDLFEEPLTTKLNANERSIRLKQQNFKRFMKGMLKSILIAEFQGQPGEVDRIKSGSLTKDDKLILQHFCVMFNVELGIYNLRDNSSYERVVCYSRNPGIPIDIYQMQGLDILETGLIYHRDLVKFDNSIPCDTRTYPFVCGAGPEVSKKVICDLTAFEPRLSAGNAPILIPPTDVSIEVEGHKVIDIPQQLSIIRAKEAFTKLIHLDNSQEGMYFALFYGLCEAVVRTSCTRAMQFILDKLDALGGLVEPKRKSAFIRVKDCLYEAFRENKPVKKLQANLSNPDFCTDMKAAIIELMSRIFQSDAEIVRNIRSGAELTRENEVLISKFCELFNVEVCIYWIDSNSSTYDRFEYFSYMDGSLIINIFQQRGLLSNTITGLLYFDEIIQSDNGVLKDYKVFPFRGKYSADFKIINTISNTKFVDRHSL